MVQTNTAIGPGGEAGVMRIKGTGKPDGRDGEMGEIGLAMALAMTVITNSGIRGYLPRTMCLICLTLMWMESALGFCLGCKIHGLLVRRGWAADDPDYEVCADGSCEGLAAVAGPLDEHPRTGARQIIRKG